MTTKQRTLITLSGITVFLAGISRPASATDSCSGRYDICPGLELSCGDDYEVQCHNATGCKNVPQTEICFAFGTCPDGHPTLACYY